jgi:APA family basic amino acid/polyamine antiporter
VASTPIEVLAGSDAPLKEVVDGSPMDALAPIVEIGAAIASLGVLLNLIPGVARTALAMARRNELPAPLAHVDRRRNHPVRAELAAVAVVLVLVVVVELHSAIALSGVAVLTYYAITNAAAFTLPANERRWPRWICVAGAIGCVALAVFLPLEVVIVGTAVLLLGVVIRRLAL